MQNIASRRLEQICRPLQCVTPLLFVEETNCCQTQAERWPHACITRMPVTCLHRRAASRQLAQLLQHPTQHEPNQLEDNLAVLSVQVSIACTRQAALPGEPKDKTCSPTARAAVQQQLSRVRRIGILATLLAQALKHNECIRLPHGC